MSLHSQGLLPKIWTRYVDGIVSMACKGKVKEMLEMRRSVENLRFIMEIEDDGEHPFLGLKINTGERYIKSKPD